MKPFRLCTLFTQRNVHSGSSNVTHNEQLLLISFYSKKINATLKRQ